ncbi:ADP-ribosyl-[dinitrogen reductase] hydrolase [Sphaerotilus hippei]|uniref:ADP-ribosyl-[dinitrogen reductase] hydrolase n=1 Tax=Sphaerotilus hippei TaxID=744406 RepID=A0A318H8K0_9BURK|nr:ADP-ribosyl-[dinitrogen reductase] hydrolase [Sphaerotilus hippei]PXW94361.1 ADP-ribosyl-[dinitrogen reductase] hydrolase [Sphaerotilus hippei]
MPDRPPLAVLHDRALGAYLGLALGDALGATVEFMTAGEIAARHGVHRQISGGGWLKLAPGQVTDDTTMALALGDALIEGRHSGAGFETRRVADHFVRWWRGKPVDCGNTCRRGIQRYLADGSLEGPPSDGDAGNGAAMRNLPVVLATLDTSDETALQAQSLAQARLTHHHPWSDAATLALARLVRALLLGQGERCEALAVELVAQHAVFRFKPYPGRASAFVVDTMQTVLHHYFAHEDFEAALVATVNRGDDADTTGALVGMLAGARCGAAALPAHWLRRLDPQVRRAITEQTSSLLACTP